MWVIFVLLDPDPDPLTRLNPDPIRILIRKPAINISFLKNARSKGYHKTRWNLTNVFKRQIFPKTIISDAASVALEWINGKSVNKTIANDKGVDSILHQGEKFLKTATISWPGNLLMGWKNKNGSYFGTKSGTLEAVGLILPFISYPAESIG